MGILTRSGKVLCDSCAESLGVSGAKSEFYADNYCDECGKPTFTPTDDHVQKCYGVTFNIGDPVYQHGNTEFVGNGVGYESFDGVWSCSSRLIGHAAEYSPSNATMVKVVRPPNGKAE